MSKIFNAPWDLDYYGILSCLFPILLAGFWRTILYHQMLYYYCSTLLASIQILLVRPFGKKCNKINIPIFPETMLFATGIFDRQMNSLHVLKITEYFRA